MGTYHVPAGPGSPSLRLVPGGGGRPGAGAPGLRRPAVGGGARRLTAWIMRGVMAATTAFALLDLYLLVSSGHH